MLCMYEYYGRISLAQEKSRWRRKHRCPPGEDFFKHDFELVQRLDKAIEAALADCRTAGIDARRNGGIIYIDGERELDSGDEVDFLDLVEDIFSKHDLYVVIKLDELYAIDEYDPKWQDGDYCRDEA